LLTFGRGHVALFYCAPGVGRRRRYCPRFAERKDRQNLSAICVNAALSDSLSSPGSDSSVSQIVTISLRSRGRFFSSTSSRSSSFKSAVLKEPPVC
jgi:hypothetical protein